MSLTKEHSPHSVRGTIERVVAALDNRGITVFARIDHAAAATSAGLELPAEEVLIFGDPKVGTMLMQADPAIGYELPLRLLVWDDGGRTTIAYRRPSELAAEYAVGAHEEVLSRMDNLLAQLVAEAVAP
jgi:uncharacterized protein (DUF302 family)